MNEWKTIDTAPKDGSYMLLICKNSIQDQNAPEPFYCISRWVNERHEYWQQVSARRKELVTEDAGHWENWEHPTHWMPLPTPPKDELS